MGNKRNLRIVVGWDRPLQTYFAQVWDGGKLEKGNLLLWVGAAPPPVETVEQLAELLAPFGTIPNDVASQLRGEIKEPWDGLTLEKLRSGR
jgi:hypothetical protein